MNEYLVLAATFTRSAPSFTGEKIKRLSIGDKIVLREAEKIKTEETIWYKTETDSWIDGRMAVRLRDE